jgi:hypothetical protein
MTKFHGTFQGQTSGPDLGDVALIFAVCAVAGVVAEVVLSVIVWIAIGLGVVTALAVAGLVWWLRGARAREARFAAALAAQRERPALTATVTPQVSQGTTAPAIEQHVHYHYHAAGQEAAPRTIPGRPQ